MSGLQGGAGQLLPEIQIPGGESRRGLFHAPPRAGREVPGGCERDRRILCGHARLLGTDRLQREREASRAGREGPGSGDRLRRGRSRRHLGPACEGSEEHHRVRRRRRKTRRSGQARREDDARYAIAGHGAKAARHCRSDRLRRQPRHSRSGHRRPAKGRALRARRPLWRRARPSAAADRATRHRHRRLVRRQPPGAEGGGGAGEEGETEADSGRDACGGSGEPRARRPESREGARPRGAGFRLRDHCSSMTPFSWNNPYAWPRRPVLAENAVATSQPLAAQAGLQMLAAGGTAVDAALATAITLTLVEPVSNGIGSDAYAIVWDGRQLHGLNASGRSPAAWTPEYFQGRPVPARGWNSVTVPGAVSAWVQLHAKFGKRP